MPIYSALEAVSPAIDRTKLILFTPFRAGRTWKLGATGYLSALATVFIPWPLIYLFIIPFLRSQPGFPAVMIPIFAGIVAVLMTIYLVVFYLASRLRFAFFEIVLDRQQFVALAWRKYGNASRRWTIFKLVTGTVLLAVLALPIMGVVHHGIGNFADAFRNLNTVPGQPPSPEAMRVIFGFYAAFMGIYAVIALFLWVHSVVGDFVVPSLALEDTTLSEAFRRFMVFIRNETGQFIGYALMKMILFFVGAMAAGICFYVVLLAVAIVAVIVGGAVGLVLHLLHVPTAVLVALGVTVGIGLYFATIFYAMFIAQGTLMTFLESYMLYFLSGRYPLLGERLAASTPQRVMASPMYPASYPPYTPPAPTV